MTHWHLSDLISWMKNPNCSAHLLFYPSTRQPYVYLCVFVCKNAHELIRANKDSVLRLYCVWINVVFCHLIYFHQWVNTLFSGSENDLWQIQSQTAQCRQRSLRLIKHIILTLTHRPHQMSNGIRHYCWFYSQLHIRSGLWAEPWIRVTS